MKVVVDVSLAGYTSLGCGGNAERLAVCATEQDVRAALALATDGPTASGGSGSSDAVWFLGYGCNSLVSDAGLPGTTIVLRGGEIRVEDGLLVADAGVWWDDLVTRAIDERLWGLELMSGIPGSVGAAVVGNIAAYGQAVADTLVWVDLLDTKTGSVERVAAAALEPGYRSSNLQESERRHLLVLRTAFGLEAAARQEVTYRTIVEAAERGGFDPATLSGRREAVLAAREAAGSLWDYRWPERYSHSAGSFFRNPLVSEEQADRLASFDESHRSAEVLRQMNCVHGGSGRRVSAALVLLAAGYERGQRWGDVRLNPRHLLKLENTGGATAADVAKAARDIQVAVKQKLGIELESEVRFLGESAKQPA
jgi:UDP-N-acetylmuramate dehydrogenase